MARRGNGEGSITRRKDGRYMARYTAHTATGPKRKTIYGKTRAEVSEKLTKAMADRDGGLVYDAENIKVGEYLQRWLEDSVRGTVKPRTCERYSQIVCVHLVPYLGRVKLKSLTPAHVRGLYRDRLEGDAGEGRRPLSPRTVRYIHVTLHKALKQAVSDGLIPRNVTEAVKAPSVRAGDNEIEPLDAGQVRTLLSTASEAGERLEALYVLAVHTGMRQGELLGLRWDDVDLEGSPSLQVRRTLDKGVFTASKTAKSRRRIELTAGAIEALRSHRKRQLEERMEKAGLWADQGLVFPNEAGGPASRYTVRSAFLRLLERAGLPRVRFHDLRHTCATLLLGKGVHPKIVQELLGHSTIAITLDTYSHVMPGMGGAAADAIDDALG